MDNHVLFTEMMHGAISTADLHNSRRETVGWLWLFISGLLNYTERSWDYIALDKTKRKSKLSHYTPWRCLGGGIANQKQHHFPNFQI